MEHEPLSPTSTSQREALEETVSRYESDVTAEAARYLLGRGIDEETARTFRLGVVADPAAGHEKFRGMLAIPYLAVEGYPLTVRFRCLTEHNHRANGHGKYMGLSGDRARVYNVGAVVEADREIHVTEGEFDAMVLNQLGYPAIAIPGANGWAHHYRVLLAGFSRVWVWADPDEAGGELLTDITRSLRQAVGVRLKQDVTDTYLDGGKDAIREALNWEKR